MENENPPAKETALPFLPSSPLKNPKASVTPVPVSGRNKAGLFE